ncbi:MAG: molybdenum ABC transporter ATP-binding protein [Muribaculaceae bacterium]|nr:molybdenum ABC transporter ATP-binding protein [Muribaculaceae bacterium]
MNRIATKFVAWDVPELDTLNESKVYKLRLMLNNGGKLNRSEKNWLTEKINSNTYFKKSVPLMGWRFDFSDILKRFFVKQHGYILEYYAVDKTSLRNFIYGRIEEIIEVNNR